jgi:hypothetical protein
VTDLEAELLMSHKYANSMQVEIQNLRSSHVEAANQQPLPDNTDQLNHEVSDPNLYFIVIGDFFLLFQIQSLQTQVHDLSAQIDLLQEKNEKLKKHHSDYLLDK